MQTYVSHKLKNQVSTSKCLELLHMNLVGHMQTRSLSVKNIFVIVDDYSIYTWVIFLSHKSDAFEAF